MSMTGEGVTAVTRFLFISQVLTVMRGAVHYYYINIMTPHNRVKDSSRLSVNTGDP